MSESEVHRLCQINTNWQTLEDKHIQQLKDKYTWVNSLAKIKPIVISQMLPRINGSLQLSPFGGNTLGNHRVGTAIVVVLWNKIIGA